MNATANLKLDISYLKYNHVGTLRCKSNRGKALGGNIISISQLEISAKNKKRWF
jgi:hypothetical protein